MFRFKIIVHNEPFVRFSGEQSVRDRIVVHIILDTLHDYVIHIPRDIQRGEPAREADTRKDQLWSADKLQPGVGRKPAAIEWRGKRVIVQDYAGTQRSSLDPFPG